MKPEMLFENCPFLLAERATLSRASVMDTDSLFAMMRDAALCRMEGESPAETEADAERRLLEAERLFQDKKALLLGVYGSEDLGNMIGWVQIDGIDPRMESVRLRCAFRASASRETAECALRAAAAYLIGTAGVNRIESLSLAENEEKHRILEAAGFRQEGVLRESRSWGSIPRADIAVHGLLARDLEASGPENGAEEETPGDGTL